MSKRLKHTIIFTTYELTDHSLCSIREYITRYHDKGNLDYIIGQGRLLNAIIDMERKSLLFIDAKSRVIGMSYYDISVIYC